MGDKKYRRAGEKGGQCVQARRAGKEGRELVAKEGTNWYSHRTGSKKKSREDGQYRDKFQTFSTDFCA
jgi:hypothetical protein